MLPHAQEEEEDDVAESLKLLGVGDSDPQQGILFQLPSLLPAPATGLNPEAADPRRRLAHTQAEEWLAALSMLDLPPGKVCLSSLIAGAACLRAVSWADFETASKSVEAVDTTESCKILLQAHPNLLQLCSGHNPCQSSRNIIP